MEKKKNNLPLVYVLGLPIILIIANSLSNLHYTILGSPLYLSVFIYPLAYLILGLVVKRTNYKKALCVMLIASITQSLFFVINWVLLDILNLEIILYSFISTVICELIFIYAYDFLIKTKKDTYVPVVILLLVVTLLENAFFGTFIEGQMFSLSILVRLFYVVIIPIILARKTSKK